MDRPDCVNEIYGALHARPNNTQDSSAAAAENTPVLPVASSIDKKKPDRSYSFKGEKSVHEITMKGQNDVPEEELGVE